MVRPPIKLDNKTTLLFEHCSSGSLILLEGFRRIILCKINAPAKKVLLPDLHLCRCQDLQKAWQIEPAFQIHKSSRMKTMKNRDLSGSSMFLPSSNYLFFHRSWLRTVEGWRKAFEIRCCSLSECPCFLRFKEVARKHSYKTERGLSIADLDFAWRPHVLPGATIGRRRFIENCPSEVPWMLLWHVDHCSLGNLFPASKEPTRTKTRQFQVTWDDTQSVHMHTGYTTQFTSMI